MGYSKVDFDKLLVSTPIDGRARSVIAQAECAEGRLDVRAARDRLKGLMLREVYFRKTLSKKDSEFKESVAREFGFAQELKRLQSENKAGFSKTKAKSNYILDVCKEVMDSDVFSNCVDEGIRRMKLEAQLGQRVELENDKQW